MDIMDPQVTKDQKELMAHRVAEGSQDPMDCQVGQAHLVSVDIQVPKATKAGMGSRDHQDRKEKQA